MSLKSQLYKSIRIMPSCIAGGYIDLEKEELVAMLAVENYPKDKLEHLVGITEDLFQGQNVRMIENIFKQTRGQKAEHRHLFQEIVVTADDMMHIYLRGSANNNHIISFVNAKTDNLVFSLTKARAEVCKLEAALRADKKHR
jgi:hypothetical protein